MRLRFSPGLWDYGPGFLKLKTTTMKVTNKTIGVILLLTAVAFVHYVVYHYWLLSESVTVEAGMVYVFAHILVVASWFFGIMELIFGDVYFSFTLPLPFANLRKSIEAKRDLNKAIREKYIVMARLQGHEFDRVHNQVKALEEKLEKMEA